MAERNFAEKAKSFVRSKRVQIAAGLTLLPAAVLGGEACGGGSDSGKTFVSGDLTQTAQALNATPTSEGTKVIVVEITPTPTPKPTEVVPTPTVLKDLFTADVADSSIDSVKIRADSFYAKHPEANDWKLLYDGNLKPQKSSIDRTIKACREGSPDAVSAKDRQLMREGTCFTLIVVMWDLYLQHPDMPELAQMAVDTRAYLISEYPDAQQKTDNSLRAFQNRHYSK